MPGHYGEKKMNKAKAMKPKAKTAKKGKSKLADLKVGSKEFMAKLRSMKKKQIYILMELIEYVLLFYIIIKNIIIDLQNCDNDDDYNKLCSLGEYLYNLDNK